MNILVTGAQGQLGREIYLLSAQFEHHFLFSDILSSDDMPILTLDITDLDAVRDVVKRHRIDLLINCAAYTNVDAAEKDIDRCELLNHHAVANLATAMQEVDGWLIHISTDYVFGGDPYNVPCRETQRGTPIGVYGAAKLRGEEAVARLGVRHLIFRTAWLYSPFGRNFVKTMLGLMASRSELKVVFDQCGTPTFAGDLAAALLQVISHPLCDEHVGIYHYSNEGVCSWYDFAVAIARERNISDCRILPCHSDEFPSAVRRPAYSVLDKSKVKAVFGLEIPYWWDSLRECLRKMEG